MKSDASQNVPQNVDTSHLKNGKLIDPAQMPNIENVLMNFPDGRYKKQFINQELKSKFNIDNAVEFDIIKYQNKLYGVYLGQSHDRHLGSGAFGSVKLAQDLQSNEWFALKLMKANNVNNEDFAKEMQNNQLADLGVGGFYREESSKGPQYSILMKYIDGITLDKLIEQENKSIPSSEWLNIAIKTLESIQKLHDKGLLHCDIKLDNFIYNPKTKEVTAIDLGMAVIGDQHMQASQYSSGSTPAYTAPEIEVDENGIATYNIKTDTFAIGCVIAQVLDLGRMDDMGFEIEIADKNDSVFLENKKIPDGTKREKVLNLVNSMVDQEPENRTSLKESIEALKTIAKPAVSFLAENRGSQASRFFSATRSPTRENVHHDNDKPKIKPG